MKIVVGLGNPGAKYDGTPHNVGFKTVDLLCERMQGEWRDVRREQAFSAPVRLGGEPVLLVKPVTFMNLSGQALREITRNRPVELSDILVISDDVALDIGRLRFRGEGSHGGHNGLRSIIQSLGSDEFARLRIGIKPGGEIRDLSDYVLSRPRPQDAKRLNAMVDMAADAVEWWIKNGTESAANKFNGNPAPQSA